MASGRLSTLASSPCINKSRVSPSRLPADALHVLCLPPEPVRAQIVDILIVIRERRSCCSRADLKLNNIDFCFFFFPPIEDFRFVSVTMNRRFNEARGDEEGELEGGESQRKAVREVAPLSEFFASCWITQFVRI